jgi:hypothetical protein
MPPTGHFWEGSWTGAGRLGQGLLLKEKKRDRARVQVAAPEGEANASQVTNAAFRPCLLSSWCYFSLLQICLDVRIPAWAGLRAHGFGMGMEG